MAKVKAGVHKHISIGQLPRYSRSLRIYFNSDITEYMEPVNIWSHNFSVIKKQNEEEEKVFQKFLTFNELCNVINETKNDIIMKNLNMLYEIAQELSKDEQPEILSSSVLFFFKLFIGVSGLLMKHILELKSMFGKVSNNNADQIYKLVKEVEQLMNEKSLNKLKTLWEKLDDPKVNNEKNQNQDQNSLSLVNDEICYKPNSKWVPPNFAKLPILDYDSKTSKLFSMAYNEEERINHSSPNFGKTWLLKQITKTSSIDLGVSDEDYYISIIDLLSTQKSDTELQDELFNLLGFARLTLIEILLKHRKDILKQCVMTNEKKNLLSTNLKMEKRPRHMEMITIETEEDKLLRKELRKEEKAIQKINRRQDSDSDDEVLKIVSKTTSASNVPTFIDPRSRKAPLAQKYPHVYDMNFESKVSSCFISGESCVIPAGAKRTDHKTHEEVYIPVTKMTQELTVGKELISIKNLDEVGQKAFHGINNLNRIQSVVFEAAYNTNENLLVCAPTGAGKTNVALLTIVHQIKQHIKNNEINKNEFKIVYVAPMKALAAEMTANFSKRLSSLGISVREFTGDMSLTKTEMLNTQILVTTPEKWDVATRKGTGDIALTSLVKLLIIDEVHLLHGDRGPVLEALVARTLRQVESSQSMIRIVGLSATLPNYKDIARFLRVNLYKGLFYFDGRFRPVPLVQTFIGVRGSKTVKMVQEMDTVCYDKVYEMVQKGHQVMVFVHARNATIKTANVFRELSTQKNHQTAFLPQDSNRIGIAKKAFERCHSKELSELLNSGFSVHHAGLLRSDRNLVEKYFAEGAIKVLVCTATLAWGVNLPAHAVIIKGTEIYDSKHGTFIDLGMLDVLQIFGRAGRPQFDTSGHGMIITPHSKLHKYLSLLTNQIPIESCFVQHLVNNLNAEVVLGTISNVEEAVTWLSYTYLFVRMRINPHVYGISLEEVELDPMLVNKRKEFIINAAMALDRAQMLRYNERTGDLSSTDMGRTASHFYISYDSVEIFNQSIKPFMTMSEILSMISSAKEFDQLKVRDDEVIELETLSRKYCHVECQGSAVNVNGKVNILLQTYLARGRAKSFSLISDLVYISQNATRIARALFDMVLRRNNAMMSAKLLEICQMFEMTQWDFESELRQFSDVLPWEIIDKIEQRKLSFSRIREMDAKELGILLRNQNVGAAVKKCAMQLPYIEAVESVQPITRTILRINLELFPEFEWNDRFHGKTSVAFWIWIEDPETDMIYHWEQFLITKNQVVRKETQKLIFTIPLVEPLPSQYILHCTSDRWLGTTFTTPLTFQHLIIPHSHASVTDLLELQPLPLSALKNQNYQSLYNFTHFNPIQTQIFHCLYHTDNNVLLGAPTGSGKTIAAEIAMFRVFNEQPESKVVYIAPLKALVRERMKDWKIRLEEKLKKSVVELTGDVTPDIRAISNSSVIVTTPEKWDGISRSWQTRNYVRQVALVVLDEVHLLGEDRGPVLEIIISRLNFISKHTGQHTRLVALTTALSTAADLAAWLHIGEMGLYNFRPSVRPVPLEVHISGYAGRNYCPRMATMNKPIYQAIRQHSPTQPVMIFVSSRRQTRLTALDLIAYLGGEDNPKQWVRKSDYEMDLIIENIRDPNLKLCLAFGLGLHHAGLQDKDRKIVEELFVNQHIQVLIATSTLAWGVNFPAHFVIVKGTEFYDGKLKRYVDMPITDVLQMMGRAGRPQYDNMGIALIMVHDIKKTFYKKFLYEPFPVESSLMGVLPDHFNAEIVAGTIKTKQDAIEYLTWTYLIQRLMKNPEYYGLHSLDESSINKFLSDLVEQCIGTLYSSYCVEIDEDQRTVKPTSLGHIASYYYLQHKTVKIFQERLKGELGMNDLIKVLVDAEEFSLLPVRHNEDLMNTELDKLCPLDIDGRSYDCPHTKTLILLQAHFSHLKMPCSDYITDLKSVLDQSIRILQAMIDISAEAGYLVLCLRLVQLMQMIIQARWITDPPVITLPNVEKHLIPSQVLPLLCLPHLCNIALKSYGLFEEIMLKTQLEHEEIEKAYKTIIDMPVVEVHLFIQGNWSDSEEVQKKPVENGKRMDILSSSEYTLIAEVKILNRVIPSKAFAPKFSKPKDVGWFMILGSIEQWDLIALKRNVNRYRTTSSRLAFTTPAKPSYLNWTFYMMSDCYLGLDQQYEIEFNVI
ncbi:activating signal cointegrator 1 complex subunit 3 [Aphis gossypii]|uniref:Activating signal cointegrator 1 complex subunit 3 n=1 Tax=Aphis gossypii TaxID=80765 RepID=A0A9P0J6D5_APHGO|nr:activating signal cointegrator 1 complex subunit 3 [Aphis gossypii]CAH1724972.1 unnamed protein product [Aphis gossypii]